jgi:hypothetical protein
VIAGLSRDTPGLVPPGSDRTSGTTLLTSVVPCPGPASWEGICQPNRSVIARSRAARRVSHPGPVPPTAGKSSSTEAQQPVAAMTAHGDGSAIVSCVAQSVGIVSTPAASESQPTCTTFASSLPADRDSIVRTSANSAARVIRSERSAASRGSDITATLRPVDRRSGSYSAVRYPEGRPRG